jgi:hypothetical protein
VLQKILGSSNLRHFKLESSLIKAAYMENPFGYTVTAVVEKMAKAQF